MSTPHAERSAGTLGPPEPSREDVPPALVARPRHRHRLDAGRDHSAPLRLHLRLLDLVALRLRRDRPGHARVRGAVDGDGLVEALARHPRARLPRPGVVSFISPGNTFTALASSPSPSVGRSRSGGCSWSAGSSSSASVSGRPATTAAAPFSSSPGWTHSRSPGASGTSSSPSAFVTFSTKGRRCPQCDLFTPACRRGPGPLPRAPGA
jgi:hypothetical protein